MQEDLPQSSIQGFTVTHKAPAQEQRDLGYLPSEINLH